MRKILVAAAIAAVVFAMSAAAYADGFEEIDELADLSGLGSAVEKVPDETRELLEKIGIEGKSIEETARLSPKDAISEGIGVLIKEAKKPFATAAAVVGITVVSALAGSFYKSFGGTGAETVGALATALLCVGPVTETVSRTVSAISHSGDFMLCFIPVYAGIMTAGGNPASAIGYNTALFAAAQIGADIAKNVLTPLVGVFLALGTVGAATGKYALCDISGAVKSAVCWALGLAVTVFIGILGVGSIVSGSADGVSAKAAKFVVSSAVPVVGGALAEAYSTVKACLAVLKSGVGSIGVITVAVLNLPTVLSGILWMLASKTAAFIGKMTGSEAVSRSMEAVNSAMTVLFAVELSFALLLIVSTTVVVTAGGVF